MVLDEFPPPLRPIVQVIDDWNTNRRLALIFEARVGGGKLLVATLDLHRGLASRPVARQMLHSLLKYAGSPAFAPRDSADLERLQGLFQPLRSTTLALGRVDSEAPGHGGAKALDGDPNTMWHTAWDPDASGFPHEIQVDLGKQTAVKGFTCLPRQDRNPNGTIADYAFYVSADGRDWGEPAARGRFDGTPKAQQVLFAEPRQGRYARLVAKSEVRGQKFASIAELVVLAE
jgi:hypothetical protein